jgi:hypothetical protein
MPLRSKLVSSLSCLLVATFGVAGCSSNPTNFGDVRVVHASSMAPNVDVKFGTDYPASNLPFGSASAYVPIPAGPNLPVAIYAAGSDSTPVLSASSNLSTNSDVTVFALGELSHLTPVIYTEDPVNDASAPTAGNVKIRVVHGSYVAGPVDVYVTAPGTTLTPSVTPTLSNFLFTTVTKYLTVPAGAYEVQVTPHGSLTAAITVPSVTLTAGQLYTAIAVDPTATSSAPGLVLIKDPVPPTGNLAP